MRHYDPDDGKREGDALNTTIAVQPAQSPFGKSAHGNFFAVDVRVFRKLITLGANATTDYIVLARGSGRDQRTSSWGVQATARRVKLAYPRGKEAREKLITAGLVRREGSPSRPTYKIAPAHEVPGCEGYRPAAPEYGEYLLNELRDRGPKRIPKKSRGSGSIAQYLVDSGFARWRDEATLEIAPAEDVEPAKWAWLPNSVVDGVAGEKPPIRLLRETQNPAVIRLFVELYHAHRLAADGGVGGRLLTRTYERQRLGERAGRVVWAFSPNVITALGGTRLVEPFMTGRMVKHGDGERDEGWNAFFDALTVLMDLGLVEFVAHLFESDTAEAELIHPCPESGVIDCLDIERRLASAARAAAGRLLLDAVPRAPSGQLLVPVKAHIARVEMRGVPRLRYRPRTSATSQWTSRSDEWAAEILAYEQIKSSAGGNHPRH